MPIIKTVLTLLLVTTVVACTWVKPTAEGEKVRVLSAEEVGNCKRLGKTTVSLQDEVVGFKRDDKTVKRELETLARNSAAGMQGDTVVAESENENGEQTFAVFRCVNP